MEIFQARFSSHQFGLHAHDTWAFGAVIEGEQDFSPRSSLKYVARAGQLTVIPPGETHAGRLIGPSACEYATLYVPDALLRSYAEDAGTPMLDTGIQVVADPGIATQFAQFVVSAAKPGGTEFALHSAWNELIGCLMRLFAGKKALQAPVALRAPQLRRGMELLRTHWAGPVTLNALAQEAQMSPAYFCRQFTKAYGLPPHRYQIVLRANQAKEMLARGLPIVEVAMAAGFSDQSHLGRHLKSCLGLTPGGIASWAAGQKRSSR